MANGVVVVAMGWTPSSASVDTDGVTLVIHDCNGCPNKPKFVPPPTPSASASAPISQAAQALGDPERWFIGVFEEANVSGWRERNAGLFELVYQLKM